MRSSRLEGVKALTDARVERVIAYRNSDTGIGGSGAVRVTDSLDTNNGVDGISDGRGSLVADNIAVRNADAGISASSSTSVLGDKFCANRGFGLSFSGTGNAPGWGPRIARTRASHSRPV